MKIVKFWRTFREGGRNFVRNGWLSLATVSVMVLSLYIMSVTLVLGLAGNMALKGIEKQLNISIYFEFDVEENRALEIKNQLENYQEIASVEYVSRNEAVDLLLNVEGDNEVIMKALDEIGENPFPHSLIIRAHDPNDYERIDAMLKASVFAQEIDEINYDRNKAYLNRLNSLLVMVQKIGLATGIIFLLISALITDNAIRLTLYSQRKEFEIMRLVGASNLYIKLPSIFEGIFYGLFASLTTLLLLGISSRYFVPLIENFLGEGSISKIIILYWWVPLITIPFIGILLGIVSSWFAMRKYLRI